LRSARGSIAVAVAVAVAVAPSPSSCCHRAVIPAKAGIHFDFRSAVRSKWIPAFAGMTARSASPITRPEMPPKASA
jgi:hypothetical protein